VCSLLINYTENLSVAAWKGYFYALLFLLNELIHSILLNRVFIIGPSCGLKMRMALTNAIYQKVLPLPIHDFFKKIHFQLIT
jgi:hypothetical protein